MPGLSVCEFLPQTARIADKIAVVRSVTSPLGEHGIANHYLLTGYKPSPVIEYPSYGAVTAHVRDGKQTLPSYVAIPETKPTAGAGFLGAAYRPFATGGDPAKPDFAVRDLDFFPGVTDARMTRRREFLDQLDRFHKTSEADPTLAQAYRLTTTPAAKKAFDLTEEKAAVRTRYGPRTIGQSCLLARRLVERGVPFVTVHNTGWDTHDGLVLRLKEGYAGAKVGVGLIPTFDIAFAALVGDLDDRGLLDETLVIAMGEFGRTPKLNAAGGRDHWPRVFSVAFAGGGVKGGQVIGSSDRVGESPKDRPVTPADLARTIYTLLGIDPDRELHTSDGRPVQINQGGTRDQGTAHVNRLLLALLARLARRSALGRSARHRAGLRPGRPVGPRRLAGRTRSPKLSGARTDSDPSDRNPKRPRPRLLARRQDARRRRRHPGQARDRRVLLLARGETAPVRHPCTAIPFTRSRGDRTRPRSSRPAAERTSASSRPSRPRSCGRSKAIPRGSSRSRSCPAKSRSSARVSTRAFGSGP